MNEKAKNFEKRKEKNERGKTKGKNERGKMKGEK
jgi:hypothetical protein